MGKQIVQIRTGLFEDTSMTELKAEHPSSKYDGMTAVELAKIMAKLSESIADLDAIRKEAQIEYDAIRKYALPDAMDNEGISNMNVTGVGRVHLRSDVYASIASGEQTAAFDWLRGTGHGGVIKSTVHTGTLKSLMKTIIREGGDLPPEELIRVQPYNMAVLTRISN